jgi:hypothetical protein
MPWTRTQRMSLLAALILTLLGCGDDGDDDSAPADDDDTQTDDDDVQDDDDSGVGDDDDSSAVPSPPCGAGDWGAISDPDNSVHVRADGSDEDGDGTAAHPLATLQAALVKTRGLAEHKRIAVGPGVFEANLDILEETVDENNDPATDSGLVIEGCSTDETAFVPTDANRPVVKVSDANDVRLAGFTLDGGLATLWVWNSASVSLDFVAVKNSTRLGVIFGGWETIVSASHLTVEDTLLAGASDPLGCGIAILDATVDLTDSAVSGSHRAGILVDYGTLTLDRVTVDGTVPGSDGSLGRGIQIQDWSEVQIFDSEIGVQEPNHDAGLFANAAFRLWVENTLVQGTAPAEFDVGGVPCADEGCPGDGIVISQGGGADDPATYVHYLYDNVVSGCARAGLVAESVVADLDGNLSADNSIVDGGTGASLFVQGNLLTDGGDPVITGTDAVAERGDPFALNNTILDVADLLD